MNQFHTKIKKIISSLDEFESTCADPFGCADYNFQSISNTTFDMCENENLSDSHVRFTSSHEYEYNECFISGGQLNGYYILYKDNILS